MCIYKNPAYLLSLFLEIAMVIKSFKKEEYIQQPLGIYLNSEGEKRRNSESGPAYVSLCVSVCLCVCAHACACRRNGQKG